MYLLRLPKGYFLQRNAFRQEKIAFARGVFCSENILFTQSGNFYTDTDTFMEAVEMGDDDEKEKEEGEGEEEEENERRRKSE